MKDDDFLNRFEDPEDMLEFIHDRLQEFVAFWDLWWKTFLPEHAHPSVSKQTLLEFVEMEFDHVTKRQVPHLKRTENGITLTGLIFGYQLKTKKDETENSL